MSSQRDDLLQYSVSCEWLLDGFVSFLVFISSVGIHSCVEMSALISISGGYLFEMITTIKKIKLLLKWFFSVLL